MLKHDDIYSIYDILTSEKNDIDKYIDLTDHYSIGAIKTLCSSYKDEAIFKYALNRIKSIEYTMISYQEYDALLRQLRASYRGELFKEQREQEEKKTL